MEEAYKQLYSLKESAKNLQQSGPFFFLNEFILSTNPSGLYALNTILTME